MRPLCKCGLRLAAINYRKKGKTFYRSLCEKCLRYGKNYGIPRWERSGYKKKNQCDKCGFKSPHLEIFSVYHVDENLDNCKINNLKTVCANCQRVLAKEGIKWKQGDLTADF